MNYLPPATSASFSAASKGDSSEKGEIVLEQNHRDAIVTELEKLEGDTASAGTSPIFFWRQLDAALLVG
jgi:hypothetical protein